MEQQPRFTLIAKTGQSNQNELAGNLINLRSSALKRKTNLDSEVSETKRQRFDPSVADLPPEIVDAILKKVTSFDLLNCRRVNRQWNHISSGILRQRADIKLQFVYNDDEFVQVIQYRRCEVLLVDNCKTFIKIGSKYLTDLVECIADATNFPFTWFQFSDLSKFCNGEVRSFLALWGKHIVTLRIDIDSRETETGILRKIIFDRVRNLKKLFSYRRHRFREDIPIPIQRSTDSSQFLLDQLEVFCVNEYHSKNLGIIESIVTAAHNLKSFVKTDSSEDKGNFLNVLLVTVPILEMLQKLNKLHCLTNAEICVCEELIRYWLKSKTSMELELRTLVLSLHPSIFKNQQIKSYATAIVSQLFRSSKDAMHTLNLPNLGQLTELEIPKLEKLQRLILPQNDGTVLMFPPSFNLAGTFPNVKELVLHYVSGIISNQQLPSVEVLRISLDYEEPVQLIEGNMKMTPNMQTLILASDFSFDSEPVDFGKFSKHWPKLEHFGWQVDIGSHRYVLHKLDSTGRLT